jgi:hypothetical protein
MSWYDQVFIWTSTIFGYLLAPIALVWGWIRWSRLPKIKTISSIFSLLGFLLATCSALLAIGSMIYSLRIGGFPFYDPRLMRMIRRGSLLSLAGFLFSLGGIWRGSSLRWLSPAGALGMLAFWICAAEGE